MNHPADYINKALKLVRSDSEVTIENIAEKLSSGTRQLPCSLWLALPADRYDENYAFIYLKRPALADIGQKIQSFYKMYVDLSDSATENGPLGGLIYIEGARDGYERFPDLTMVHTDAYVVQFDFGS